MPTPTYSAIQSTILSSATQTVSLTGIPSTYTDLVVVISAFSDSGTNGIRMRINNDSSGIYDNKYWSATPSNTSVGANASNQSQVILGNYTNTPTTHGQAIHILNIFNYANTSVFKKVGVRSAFASGSVVDQTDCLYKSTNAINRLDFNINTFGSSTGNFAANSTFTIYGIRAA
jgi:hypothetical protein